MKNLIKVIALVLSLVLVIGLLSGCQNSNNNQNEQNNEQNNTQNNEQNNDENNSSEQSNSNNSGENAIENEEPTELTMLIGTDEPRAGIDAVIELAEEKLNLEINVELSPGGSEGDNMVKTRLASGDMTELCQYNSGSLLSALNPSEYFIDLSNEDFVNKLDETYKQSVTINGEVFGVPTGSTQAGAILYSKPIYEELNLSVPKTWDEFISNCDAIKESGKTAIYGSLGDSWTTQVMYLGDHYNVALKDPDFAKEFEAGNTKYATNPAGLRSWEKLEATVPYYNEDAIAATYDDGCNAMANAEAGHWVMLTLALSNIYELYGDKVNDIGVFGIPDEDPDKIGLTVWMPLSIYGYKHTEKEDAILDFLEFYISDEALDVYAANILPDGPYCVKGYEIPDNAYEAVRTEMQEYFDDGRTETALEFQTPVKGPNCDLICQELTTGQTTALEAAEAYDADCLKQAVQLGLDWE